MDLDGTANRGTEVIQKTLDFLQKLHYKRISFLFLTKLRQKHRQWL